MEGRLCLLIISLAFVTLIVGCWLIARFALSSIGFSDDFLSFYASNRQSNGFYSCSGYINFYAIFSMVDLYKLVYISCLAGIGWKIWFVLSWDGGFETTDFVIVWNFARTKRNKSARWPKYVLSDCVPLYFVTIVRLDTPNRQKWMNDGFLGGLRNKNNCHAIERAMKSRQKHTFAQNKHD